FFLASSASFLSLSSSNLSVSSFVCISILSCLFSSINAVVAVTPLKPIILINATIIIIRPMYLIFIIFFFFLELKLIRFFLFIILPLTVYFVDLIHYYYSTYCRKFLININYNLVTKYIQKKDYHKIIIYL